MVEKSHSRRKFLTSVAAGFVAGGVTLTTDQESPVDSSKAALTESQGSHNQERLARRTQPRVNTGNLTDIDKKPGTQVRVRTTDETARYRSVLWTVPENLSESVDSVTRDLREQLGVDDTAPLFVREYAPHQSLTTDEQAKRQDEFVEYLTDRGCTSLVVTAPHGGRIEYLTDDQAKIVGQELGVTEWGCVGYNSDGGAFDRWHVTSTKISRASFPKLDSIADRAFEHAVSFHGFTEDGIAVGGGAPRELKDRMVRGIDDATEGQYDVYVPRDDSPYAGNDRSNFVNWLCDGNGIQLEQSYEARTKDWKTIATAVASVYEDVL